MKHSSSLKSKHRIKRLRPSDIPEETHQLAKYLIGKVLVHDLPDGRVSGRIVETEAYPPGDSSAHAFRGLSKSNQSLFLGHGHCYVYFTYGNWFMLNISSEKKGVGAGVLIRALEPLDGIQLMQKNRNTTKLLNLTRGPARLAQAFQITKTHDGHHYCSKNSLWLGEISRPAGPIGVSVRIGISREIHQLRRFFEKDNPFVSGKKSLNK